MAPPPVETWSTSSSRPNWASAAARVAAADHGERLGVGHRLGDGARAGGEPLVLEHAHRAVPEHHAGVHDHVGERGGRAGPDVEALGAVGQAGAERGELAAASTPVMSSGRWIVLPLAPASASSRLQVST